MSVFLNPGPQLAITGEYQDLPLSKDSLNEANSKRSVSAQNGNNNGMCVL